MSIRKGLFRRLTRRWRQRGRGLVVIGINEAFCEHCELPANPEEIAHLTVPGDQDASGCMITYDRIFVNTDLPTRDIDKIISWHRQIDILFVRRRPDSDSDTGSSWHGATRR
jgi:hypothetical protein